MIDPGYRSNSATEFPELYLPGIDPELDGIPGIRRNFQWFPGIPKSQVTGAYLGMIHPGYRLNSVTEFPELYLPGIDPELDGIPGIRRNSHWFPGISESQATWDSLVMVDPGYWSNSATEFPELHRDGISSCNSGIPRNSFQFPGIPTNSHRFRLDVIPGIPWRNCFLPSPSLSTMYMVID
jgi:hypothetical protein